MADDTPVTPTPAATPPENTGGAGGSWDEATPTEQFIHNAATAAVGAVKGAASMGKEILFPEGDTEVAKVKDIAKKLIIDPATKMEMKAQTAKTPAESLGYSIAEGLPVIGPYIADTSEQVGQQWGSGHRAAAAGTVVGNLLAAKAGEAVGETTKAVVEHPAVSEQLAKLGTHLNATTQTALTSMGEGVNQIATAQAPTGSPEAGFAKIGGKKVGVAPKSIATVPDNSQMVAQNRPAIAKDNLERAPEHGIQTTPDGNLILYHGTKAGNAIRTAGELKQGSYLAATPETAQQYAEGARGAGKPEVMRLEIPAGLVLGNGDYYSANEPVPYKPAAARQAAEPEKFASVGGKFVGKPPEPPAPPAASAAPEPYHPDLQKVADMYGLHQDPSKVANPAQDTARVIAQREAMKKGLGGLSNPGKK